MCCLSDAYLASPVVAKEVKLAALWGKCIMPVTVGALSDPSGGIPSKHAIAPHVAKLYALDLHSQDKFHARARELLSRLGKHAVLAPDGRTAAAAPDARQVPVAEMQPDDVCQLLARLFIPPDKVERFAHNGVSGKDLLAFSDEDFKGDDLGLSAIQARALPRAQRQRAARHLTGPPRL